MVSRFNKLSFFQNDNQVSRGDGAKAVGDDKGGAVFPETFHGTLNQLLAFRIERAGCFIQDQEPGV